MKKFLSYAVGALVVLLAIYGAVRLLTGFLTESHGERGGKAAEPSVPWPASAVAEKLKQSLKEIPDAKLEQDSEWLAKKLYPITKGIIKGQVESFLQDPERNQLPEKMYHAGREFSDKVLRPFGRGIVDSNQQTIEGADKTLDAIRKFSDTNKDLLDAVKQGLDAFSKTFREDRLPRPEPPGPNLGPPPPLPPLPQQDQRPLPPWPPPTTPEAPRR